eukprot:1801967-Rhodomonas_salina.1
MSQLGIDKKPGCTRALLNNWTFLSSLASARETIAHTWSETKDGQEEGGQEWRKNQGQKATQQQRCTDLDLLRLAGRWVKVGIRHPGVDSEEHLTDTPAAVRSGELAGSGPHRRGKINPLVCPLRAD